MEDRAKTTSRECIGLCPAVLKALDGEMGYGEMGREQSEEEDREVPWVPYLRGLALTSPSLGRTESWEPPTVPGAGRDTKLLPPLPPGQVPACLCSKE